jgi:hypothetical protein
MSAFENFIQIELPKRPYTDTDVPQESLLVRRGPGPRQLQAATINEGEVVARIGGVITGVTLSSLGGVNKLVLDVPVAASVWTMTHPFSTTDAIIQVTDASGYVILAEAMQIVNSSTVQITFGTPQAGKLRAIFW